MMIYVVNCNSFANNNSMNELGPIDDDERSIVFQLGVLLISSVHFDTEENYLHFYFKIRRFL